MRMVIPGFEHRPGQHCGSTAMADVLRTVGLDLSEPMAFGLGAGTHFIILEGPGLNPSTMFFGRSISFEQDLCRQTNVVMDERATLSFDDAWAQLRGFLLEGRATLLVTDIKFLPHYGTQTHFNGHRIALAGMDEEAGLALVADTHFPGLCEVPLDLLRQSMESDAPPVVARECTYAALSRPTAPLDRVAAARRAIRAAAESALEEGGHVGVLGIERLAKSIAGWGTRSDRTWCARFGYQVIEKRGTGGGLFRKLYAAFLREAGSEDARILALAPLAEEAAASWTELAMALKGCSEAAAPAFDAAAELATRTAVVEKRLWAAAMGI